MPHISRAKWQLHSRPRRARQSSACLKSGPLSCAKAWVLGASSSHTLAARSLGRSAALPVAPVQCFLCDALLLIRCPTSISLHPIKGHVPPCSRHSGGSHSRMRDVCCPHGSCNHAVCVCDSCKRHIRGLVVRRDVSRVGRSSGSVSPIDLRIVMYMTSPMVSALAIMHARHRCYKTRFQLRSVIVSKVGGLWGSSFNARTTTRSVRGASCKISRAEQGLRHVRSISRLSLERR